MEVIKQLVDSITSQLTMILMKIESLSPVIDRLHDDITNDSKTDQVTLETVKSLDSKMGDFKETLISLPRTIERIQSMEQELIKVKNELIEGFDDVKTKLEPVYEVNKFLSGVKDHILFWIAVITTAPSVIPALIVWIKSITTAQ